MDDAGLAGLAREGDTRALAELYRRHHHVVLQICRRYGPDGAAADLAHDAFAKLLLHVHQLDEPAKVAHWLKRVARNLAIDAARLHDHRRSSPRDPHGRHDEPADVAGTQEVEDRVLIASLLDRLRPADARLLVEHYLHDRPLAEIADHQRSTSGSVKVRLHRSRQRAREAAEALGLRGLLPAPLHRWLRAVGSSLQQVPLAPVAGTIVGGIALGVGLSVATAANGDGRTEARSSGVPVVASEPGGDQQVADLARPALPSTVELAHRGARPSAVPGPERDRIVAAQPVEVPMAGTRVNTPPPDSPDYEIGAAAGTEVASVRVAVLVDDPDPARPVAEAACAAAEAAPDPAYCERGADEDPPAAVPGG